MKKKRRIKVFKNMNKSLLIMTLIFAIGGAFLILDASSISSVLTYGNDSPYYYFQRQLIFIAFSLFCSIVIIHIDTKWYKGISLLLSLLFTGLLGIVYIKNSLFSSSVSEVTLSLFGGRFQPAEFLKVFLVMYMGCFYGTWANKEEKSKFSFVIPLILCITATGLIALGGDFGSAAIMIALYVLVFASVPSEDKIVKWLKKISIACLLICVFVLKFAYLVVPEDVLASKYRLNRFIYTHPCDRYEENSGYQVCNGYIAIDNGGLLGVGIGDSIQKYMYLPASHTDFIFPIVVEELGVIAGVLIIIGFMAILYLIFRISVNTNKLQNSIICYGIGIYFMLHIFVNLGGVLGVIPLTGIPLPFLSYGGSFCMALICSFAVIQRIHIENQEYKKNAELKNNN